jgi:galactoside O-acetyltransferase
VTPPRFGLPGDWYARGVPGNVHVGRDVYLDSSYGFDGVVSTAPVAVSLGDATGAYDRAAFLVGPRGRVTVGRYTVLNGCVLIAEERVTVGDHCLLAWGAVVTDVWAGAAPLEARRAALRDAFAGKDRWPGPGSPPRPVSLADNVWVGFDAVVMPGVAIGRGAVVSARSVVGEDVPPYAVAVGNPARVVRYLTPDDDDSARQRALLECSR